MKRSEAGNGREQRRDDRKEKKSGGAEVKIPHDVVNEQVVLAASCVDRDARKRLVQSVPTDAMFGKGHPEIWEVIKEIDRLGLDFDLATVQQLSNGAVDTRYLETLITQRPELPRNLNHHLDCLAWDQARVEAARGPISGLLEALRDVTTEPDRVRALARQVSESFNGKGLLKYLRDPGALVRSVQTNIRKRRDGHALYPYGIPGFDVYTEGDEEGLYRVVPGAAPRMITVVTGVSGSGKSTVIANKILGLVKQGRKVLYGSWEQDAEISLEQLAVIDLGLSRSKLMTGAITDEEERLVVERVAELVEMVRFFELPFGRVKGEKQLNDRNLDLIHSYIAETGCDVFIADLWRRAMRQFDPDEEENALYRQQAIMKETNTHGILVHQQRLKDLEQRSDKRPTRETIKGSGTWVEVPDTIIGVHLPGLWKRVETETLEMIILKQRFGRWPLAVEFDYDGEHGQILNGRGIEYSRPGEKDGMDAWLDGDRSAEREKKGSKSGSTGRRRKFGG